MVPREIVRTCQYFTIDVSNRMASLEPNHHEDPAVDTLAGRAPFACLAAVMAGISLQQLGDGDWTWRSVVDLAESRDRKHVVAEAKIYESILISTQHRCFMIFQVDIVKVSGSKFLKVVWEQRIFV